MSQTSSDLPKKVLGWDTSGKKGYLFALEVFSGDTASSSGVLRHSAVLDVDQKQHSEGLLLGISEALDATHWKLEQIAAFGVGLGPGSFTGVRIGVTTARTLGQMTGIPVIGASSLEMLENTVLGRYSGDQGPILTCVDACMGEIYCRWNPVATSGASERVVKLAKIEDYLEEIGAMRSAGVNQVILPDRWMSQSILAKIFLQPRWKVMELSSIEGQSHSLAAIIARELKSGASRSALDVHPVYLRVSDAELHRKDRENALRNTPIDG
ncbi:MAG: tRNA (adenosine(37)-N6)-threonylcarbamoyltransferase complex dimerization subunit type 1 TsaB [Bdellovibrionales bacterium]|nr:tRNA (adenosine(37)-N6)-threonylcarbamoyltransferase complex dimerization subunit type 1 TsaB [Bdellovibrionales bacterium]